VLIHVKYARTAESAWFKRLKLARAQSNFAIHFYDPSQKEEEEKGEKEHPRVYGN
jgi:hypothetical protein